MKKTKKIALIIAVLMFMAVCFAFGVSAERAVIASGNCGAEGDNVTWVLYDDGELVISGEGAMKDYAEKYDSGICYFGAPWNLYRINILKVVVEEGVTSIGNAAFGNLSEVIDINIPSTVETIGFDSLITCEKIVVDENNKNYSCDTQGVLFNKDKSVLVKYPRNKLQTLYEIPYGVITIADKSFFESENLISIIIPNTVKTIGKEAFGCCDCLTSITIPSSVEFIDYYAFGDCYSLESVAVYGKALIEEEAFFGCLGVTDLYVSEEVEFVGANAFMGLIFLNNAVIKSMTTTFEDYSLCASPVICSGISRDEFIDLYKIAQKNNDKAAQEKVMQHITYYDEPIVIGTIYCHAGSTAEAYAIENGVDYELTHFYEGEWTYNYENNVRTRKCIHCDELQVEELEIEEVSGNEFLLIKETVINGIEGNVEVLKAFDINLKNSDGVHVQPDGTIKVKLPNDWSKNGVYKVYRVEADGTLTDMNAYRQGSHIVFDTDHFSIYVIVVEGVADNEPETPEEPDTSDCNCICHKEGFIYEILAIVFKFVAKITGVFPVCECGIAHY